jgi:hypothetical protein
MSPCCPAPTRLQSDDADLEALSPHHVRFSFVQPILALRSSAREYPVNLGGHNEIVPMKSLDLLGLQRDRGNTPTEADIRMMTFNFREFTNFLNKGKRLPEIAKPEAPLNAVSFLL